MTRHRPRLCPARRAGGRATSPAAHLGRERSTGSGGHGNDARAGDQEALAVGEADDAEW